jgi:hypothetical protein
MNQTRVKYMYIWKCHKEPPLYNYHILTKTLKRKTTLTLKKYMFENFSTSFDLPPSLFCLIFFP